MQLDNDIIKVTFSDFLLETSSLIFMCKISGIPLELHHIHTHTHLFLFSVGYVNSVLNPRMLIPVALIPKQLYGLIDLP